jgi:GNAT superfamily N-acetyltransferase
MSVVYAAAGFCSGLRKAPLQLTTLTGSRLESALKDLARLRIEVFRDFPYLYEGSPGYEESYVLGLARSKDAIIAAAEDEGRIVGCATGSALLGHHEEFAAPFLKQNLDPAQVFYCGESVLLPAYRGRGLGHQFFNLREGHAKHRGYKYSAFCGVVRPKDHPLRPANYVPLDAFWQKRGYRKVPGLTTAFRWKDIDMPDETEHPMQFWMRELD